jgi:hypothetical protein
MDARARLSDEAPYMKPLFWIGLVLCLLGIASLLIPIPRSEAEGFSVGDVSVDLETRHSETIPLALSVLIMAGGLGLVAVAVTRRNAS